MAAPKPTLIAFGNRLRALRKARGWTQEELARRTERHWTYLGGLERGERNPSLVVLSELAAALEVGAADLVGDAHELCAKLGASANDILDAIAKGFRAQIDVKGKLAELFMSRQLENLRSRKTIEGFVWQDVDGAPDFVVKYRGRELVLECKNVRNEAFARPPSYKVELQRTRNSKDGSPTRGYRASDFEVLGVALFNQTRRWEFLYISTKRLERRPEMPDFLAVMQRVPMVANEHWTSELQAAMDEALRSV